MVVFGQVHASVKTFRTNRSGISDDKSRHFGWGLVAEVALALRAILDRSTERQPHPVGDRRVEGLGAALADGYQASRDQRPDIPLAGAAEAA